MRRYFGLLNASKLVILRNNSVYRFADVVRKTGLRWHHDRQKILHEHSFFGSILQEYLSNCSKCSPNYSLLAKICTSKRKSAFLPTPLPHELVIHIRAGDIVERETFLQTPFLSLIKNMVMKYPKIDTVTIVSAMHFGNFAERNLFMYTEHKRRQNVAKMHEMFRMWTLQLPTLNFQLLSTESVDVSVVYIVHSPFIIFDRGGFSYVLAKTRLNIMSSPIQTSTHFGRTPVEI